MALPALYADETLVDKDQYTEAEYFALEDGSLDRWEFLPDGPPNPNGPRLGRVRAMSGGSPKHSALGMRLGRRLGNALEAAGKQACEVYGSDLKVRTADERITFPDVSVVRGKPAFYRERDDVLTNPLLLGEVLTETTEAYDRGDKWASYRTIPTLQHFLLLESEWVRVEVHTREGSGWHLDIYEDMTAQIPLPALGVTISLADVYEQVDFEQED